MSQYEGNESDDDRESCVETTETVPSPFQWEEGFTDINLIVEGMSISVNKGFLMTVSPVFKRMFLSDFKEKNATEVELHEKKYAEIADFFRYLMQEKNPELTDERIDFLIPLASEYQTYHLMLRCENFLLRQYFDQDKNKPTRHQLLKFISFGLKHECKRLEEKARRKLSMYRFTDIEKDEIFEDLPTECKLELHRQRIKAVEEQTMIYCCRLRGSFML